MIVTKLHLISLETELVYIGRRRTAWWWRHLMGLKHNTRLNQKIADLMHLTRNEKIRLQYCFVYWLSICHDRILTALWL